MPDKRQRETQKVRRDPSSLPSAITVSRPASGPETSIVLLLSPDAWACGEGVREGEEDGEE
eukprot:2022991-Pyramimonas_sp.AAC.1